jgi:hypothetical protein
MPVELKRHFLAPHDRLYFLHIPKAAGTTVTFWLRSHFSTDETWLERMWVDSVHLSREEFSKYRLFTGHFSYSLCNLFDKPPVILTILREPFARTLSFYEFVRRRKPQYPYKRLHDEKLSLVDFLRDPELRKTVCNDMVGMLVEDYPYEKIQRVYAKRSVDDTTPSDYVLDNIPPDEALDIARQRLTDFAAFGLSERFHDSLNLFTYTFGWSPVYETQNLNVGSVENHPQDLTPLEREVIEETNQLDIALYAYARTLFEQRYAELVCQLLDDDYRRLPVHRNQTQRDQLALSMRDALPGTGWQAFDPFHPTMRWTGPETISTLDLSLTRDHPLQLSFRIVTVMAQDILDSFQVRVNGRMVSLMSHSNATGGGIALSAVLTPELLASETPLTRISFHVSRTISPRDVEPQNVDERALGVAIADVRIDPL